MTLIEQSIKEATEEFDKQFMSDGELLVPEGKDDAKDIKAFIATHMHKLAKELRKATQVEESSAKHITGQEKKHSWGRGLIRGYNQCRTDINDKWKKI